MAIKGCILPWVHIYGDLRGDYRVCCFSDQTETKDYSLGSSSESLLEVWQGDKYKNIRQQFLDGKIPTQCQKACYDKEALGVEQNPKHNANSKWAKYEHLQTTITPPPPIFIDFRFGNLCNFRCRSCGPMASTSWIKESKSLFKNENAKILDSWTNNDKLWEALEDIYPTIDTIYFAGGEPFVLEGHYKLLEFLISKGKTDITINYNTNLSILKYKTYDLPSIWKQFKTVNLWVSCDGYGQAAEYIRKELDWEEFNSNVDKVKPYIRTISAVIYTLSIYSMPELLLWANSKGIPVFGTTLINPNYLSCQVLPRDEKLKIVKFYKDFLDKHKHELHKHQILNILDWLRFLMGSVDNREELEQKFKSMTSILDRNRNENFTSVVPELADWYDSIKIY
jgi:organic radical activating enzyme